MERMLEIGSAIVYIDPYRKRHNALATNVFRQMNSGKDGCNLLFVVDEAAKTDPYGHQIERATSQVHLSAQPAKAGCWCWPDEVPEE